MATTQKLSAIATAVLALCAVTLTALVVRRELNPDVSIGRPKKALEPISNWSEVAEGRHRDGPLAAAVTLVVFEDFECPACKYFATVTLPEMLSKFPNQLQVVRRHSPLSYHRFAYPAARAAECAAVQGRFLPMHQVLFEKADSFGLKAFVSYALDAGVPDTVAFASCQSRSDSLPEVNRDRDLVVKIGGTGTPTIALDGMLFTGVPTAAQLEEEIAKRLKSSEPR